ncbi:MAG: site-2 protease family protein [Tractidigestivibacter sp.]|uniref:site-2 protease family protein n=1 Tax=Tractidigestivibacter sp. TaxID=2847320 RepID=UPI003D94027E
MYSTTRIIQIAISVLLVMLSVVPHEVAHGWMADKLGDHTARQAGRLSLNPAKHIDPVGSILLPLIMGLLGGPIFAYAKPVPYNPMNFKRETRRRDEALVALAGPVMNFIEALAGTALYYLALNGFEGALMSEALPIDPWLEVASWVVSILYSYVYVNLMLMCFNLIPLPPLDGSKVISIFIKSDGARRAYYQVQRYSMPILIAVLYLIPYAFGVDPLGWLLDVTAGNLCNLLLGA